MDLTALHGEALDTARQIEDPKERSMDIAALATMRSLDDRDDLIDEAVIAARLVKDPRERLQALSQSLMAATRPAASKIVPKGAR